MFDWVIVFLCRFSKKNDESATPNFRWQFTGCRVKILEKSESEFWI